MKNYYTFVALFLLVAISTAQRIDEELVLFYPFQEGSGTTIHNYSSQDNSDVEIATQNEVSWNESGGLTFTNESKVHSVFPVVGSIQAIQNSQALTLECWLQSANNSQIGPARIMTISNGSGTRNASLNQLNGSFLSRVRTSETGNNGMPNFTSPENSVDPNALQHVVYTLNAAGEERFYINGELVQTGNREGDFSGWNANYRISFGNEIGASRPWMGSLHLAAVYSTALSEEQVVQNFNASAYTEVAAMSEENCGSENCFVNGFGEDERVIWFPSLPNGIHNLFKFDTDGGHFEVFEDGTAHLYGNTVNMEQLGYGWAIDVWFKDRMGWEAWSGLGREWKGSPEIVGDLYQTWDYFIMDPDKENTLTGLGNYEGSLLNLTHKPSNYHYGFQIGLAANDQNAEHGMSCWFNCSGNINDEVVEFNGDINLEGGCANQSALECLVDVEVDCEQGDYSPEITGLPEVLCGSDYTMIYADEVISDECPLIIERTFTVTFENGTTATCTQQITLIDETIPEFANLPEDVFVSCSQIPEPSIEVTDECGFGDAVWTSEDQEFSGACLPTIQRTFAAIDACGNESVHVQYIYLQDNVPPVFMNDAENLTLECGEAIPEFSPLVIDDCGEPVLTMSQDTTQTGCNLQVVQVWTASDACGGVSSLTRIIDFIDTQAPTVLGFVENITAQCNEIPSTELEFSDNCSEVSVEFTEDQTGAGCNYTLIRTWLALDACGNTTIVSQEIEVEDDTSPQFSEIELELAVECENLNSLPHPIITDNCSLLNSDYTEEVVESDHACYAIQRTWEAVDACGNESSINQLVHVFDVTPPVLVDLPESGPVSCEALDSLPSPFAMDNCDDSPELLVSEEITSSNCQYQISRTYSASDHCGNQVTATVFMEYEDTSALEIQGSSEVFIECSDLQTDAPVDLIDDCSSLASISFTDEIISSEGCERTILRTWIGNDACGEAIPFVQTIVISDHTPPVFNNIPEDLTVSCSDPLPAQEPLVEDYCGEVNLQLIETLNGSPCNQVLSRIWIATDACGNQASIEQRVFIVDDEVPQITGDFDDVLINCQEDIPAAIEVIVSDNCDEAPEYEWTESIAQGNCNSDFVLTRTITAIDACGNESDKSYQIVLQDNEAPVFDQVLDELFVDCGMISDPVTVTASDDCGEVIIDYIEMSESGGCPSFTRIWTATDLCGNTNVLTQLVNVSDNEPPVFEDIPSNVEVSCTAIPDIPEPEVSDNCDEDVAVTLNESIIGTGCEFTIIRTWIASDDCGNTSIFSQSINVLDEGAPVFVNAPDELEIECSELDNYPYPNVFDDCDVTVNITSEDEVLGAGCAYDVARTYTAFDLCGNSASHTVLFHVTDTQGPSISGVPANSYISCGQIPAANEVEVLDNCSEVTWEVNDFVIGEGCSYIINRSYIAEDACGNQTGVTQLISVEDQSVPEIMLEDEVVIINCNEEWPPIEQAVVVDDCSENLSINNSSYIETTECGEVMHIIWTANDDCGNASTLVQQVRREDNTAPEFQESLPDVLTYCTQIPEVVMPSAVDDCSHVTVNFEEQVILGACPYEIRRTFTAEDNCGNSNQMIQSIWVMDIMPPVLSQYPADIEVSCGNVPQAEEVFAIDECENAMVQFDESMIQTACSSELRRTWTATDACGNQTQHQQLITIVDEFAPYFIDPPANMTTNCVLVESIQGLEVWDDCSELIQEYEEVIIPTECETEYSLLRTWTASDGCGNTIVHVQEIGVIDDIAPLIIGVPEDLTLSCGDQIPGAEVTAMDACGESVELTFNEIVVEGESQECSFTNAISNNQGISLWLPGLNGIDENFVIQDNSGQVTVDPVSGGKILTGNVVSVSNPQHMWTMNIELGVPSTWETWSSHGRDFKDDTGLGADHYQDWLYHVLNAETSHLIGAGALEGSYLSLSHAPGDTLFGFQEGIAANNRNAEYGMSGWFFYSGNFGGEYAEGAGDVIIEMNCCQERRMIREWIATDCAGNTVSATQFIEVLRQENFSPLWLTDLLLENFSVTSGEGSDILVDFSSEDQESMILSMHDQSGRMLNMPLQKEVIEGGVYQWTITKDNLKTGIYVVVLEGENKRFAERTLVIK